MQIQTVSHDDGRPLSQAAILGGVIYTSGHVGTDPATGSIVSGFADQMHCAMRNLEATLKASNGSLSTIASARIFITDAAHFDEMNAIYSTYLKPPMPARSTIVTDLADKALLFEIEVVAHVLDEAPAAQPDPAS
jgi:2-iminobutanoate/2-iminopropanoate deaminase